MLIICLSSKFTDSYKLRGQVCMQDTFARATHSGLGQARRATIGYLVYKGQVFFLLEINFLIVSDTDRGRR